MTTCHFRGGPADGTCRGVSEHTDSVMVPEVPGAVMGKAVVTGEVPETVEAIRHLYARSAVRRDLFIYQGLEGAAKQEIAWTQYLLPDGRRTSFTMEVPADVADKAARLEKAGLFLEAEVLRTGEVSLTIADREEEVDADIRVVPNGPAVTEAALDLIRRFDLEGYSR